MLKYFYEENSGCPSVPRNLGIEKASGKYVAFLDSDDEWFPTKLEKQLAIFENSNNPKLGVVACYLYVKDYKTGKIVSKHDKYYRDNREKTLERQKNYQKNNKEKIKEKNRLIYIKNKEYYREKHRLWELKNREKRNKYRRELRKRKRLNL